jgi:pSer/pThr/pTyr-binding forkhead associated (FHA) protein
MNSTDTDTADRPILSLDLVYNGASTRVRFNQPVLRIGRAVTQPPLEIHLADETVSRRHAEIRWQGRTYWIADTDSLTGTYVDGERLHKGDRRAITTGTQLRFGETRASVRIERQGEGGQFDIYLCHSGADRLQVRLIGSELRQAGLNPFLDEDAPAASANLIAELSSALRTSGSADLGSRVWELARAFPDYAEHLGHAFEYQRPDAASSLTKSRLVMEQFLVQLYTVEMGREPRKPLLGEMLADNQFTRRLERRIVERMDGIRGFGNLGPHGEKVEPIDATRALDDVCVVLDWHLRRGRAGADPGAPRPRPPALLRGCSAAVIWGPNSPGRWQMKEIEILQEAASTEALRLIAVILPDVQRDPAWPGFMDLVQQIDFRKRHLNPMNQLIAILKGPY